MICGCRRTVFRRFLRLPGLLAPLEFYALHAFRTPVAPTRIPYYRRCFKSVTKIGHPRTVCKFSAPKFINILFHIRKFLRTEPTVIVTQQENHPLVFSRTPLSGAAASPFSFSIPPKTATTAVVPHTNRENNTYLQCVDPGLTRGIKVRNMAYIPKNFDSVFRENNFRQKLCFLSIMRCA